MKSTMVSGWFSDTSQLKNKSYWIYAGGGKHYLGHYRYGDWEWEQPDRLRPHPMSGKPPSGTVFRFYREVTSAPFTPYKD